ncbi:MAG TPA: response regulator [Aliidongia sp.]|nr:response regulator [Aliidongia sp.]
MTRILLVEDDGVIRAMSSHLLRNAGYSVTEGKSGLEALRLLSAAKFDVLITDLFMPDMDGMELIQSVRAAGSSIRIIAISGSTGLLGDDLPELARSIGVDLVMRKPVAPAALLTAIGIEPG